MDEFEYLRLQWQKHSVPDLNTDTRTLISGVVRNRVVNTQQKLIRYYKRTAIAGVVLPVLSTILYRLGMPMWLVVFYALFGIAAAITDFWFASYIRKTRIVSLPVIEAIGSAVKIYKIQLWLHSLSIIIAVLFIITPLYYFVWKSGNEPMLIGMVTGTVIGGVIGAVKCARMFRLSKQMIKALEVELIEEK